MGATETAVILKHSGSVTFENCVFQNARNCVYQIDFNSDLNRTTLFDEMIEGVVNNVKRFLDSVKGWSPMDGFVRHLKAAENMPSGQSHVGQTIPAVPRLAVRLVGCVFQGNSVAARASAGMITVVSSGTDLLIWDTLFLENDYGSNLVRAEVLSRRMKFRLMDDLTFLLALQQNGYAAIVSDGSSVNLRNNCFVNNLFSGVGVIIVHTDDILLPVASQAINNAGTNDGRTTCEFIGLISSNAFESGL